VPVHQGRGGSLFIKGEGGGPHQERGLFIKGRRRPFYLTHRRRLFIKGGRNHSSKEGGAHSI